MSKNIALVAIAALFVSLQTPAWADGRTRPRTMRITMSTDRVAIGQEVEFDISSNEVGRNAWYGWTFQSPLEEEMASPIGGDGTSISRTRRSFDEVGTWRIRCLAHCLDGDRVIAYGTIYVHDGRRASGHTAVRIRKIQPDRCVAGPNDEITLRISASGGSSKLVYKLERLTYRGGRPGLPKLVHDWTPNSTLRFKVPSADSGPASIPTQLYSYRVQVRESNSRSSRTGRFHVLRKVHRQAPLNAWADFGSIRLTDARDPKAAPRPGRLLRIAVHARPVTDDYPVTYRLFAIPDSHGDRASASLPYLGQFGPEPACTWRPDEPGYYIIGVEANFGGRGHNRKIYHAQRIYLSAQPLNRRLPGQGSKPTARPARKPTLRLRK
jgi:hypothetical protein